MHNFPPHLNSVATLPENTLATDRHVVFLWVGGPWKYHGWCDQQTSD